MPIDAVLQEGRHLRRYEWGKMQKIENAGSRKGGRKSLLSLRGDLRLRPSRSSHSTDHCGN